MFYGAIFRGGGDRGAPLTQWTATLLVLSLGDPFYKALVGARAGRGRWFYMLESRHPKFDTFYDLGGWSGVQARGQGWGRPKRSAGKRHIPCVKLHGQV